ncbi:MAG: aminopeptidase P N-terminal domain-containing protein [Candidatus Aminicenantaceae bacterium]
MNKKKIFKIFVVFFLFIYLLPLMSIAQRTGYSKEEFINRRNALMNQAGKGLIILFAEARYIRSTDLTPGAHFRQDNDFYYFTGNEDQFAILVMVTKTMESYLFMPDQTEREIMVDGPNWLNDNKAKEKSGLTDIYALSYFDEFLSRNLNGQTLYLRLTPRGTQTLFARRSKSHYNAQISLDNYRLERLRKIYPAAEMKDVTPFIDSLRLIKTDEEIEVLRRIGRISAEGIKQAMLATRPGGFEYEAEAAAKSVILKHGARGPGYPPIVGSGPNSCYWHYSKNSRKMEEGDLVLMDFGGDLDYMIVDITRTWPVSGKFTPEQKEAYKVALEIQKACIEAYAPGVTVEDVKDHVAEVLERKGIDVPEEIAHCGPAERPGTIGHYVGMAVHDVGERGIPLREGMVFAIEPGIYYPEKNMGIRIEDTVLITENGCENLTKNVPKEIEEIEELMSGRKKK